MTSTNERYEIAMEDAAKVLWRQYRKTPEYKSGRRFSINSEHKLVRSGEEKGLSDVILLFVKELRRPVDIHFLLCNRTEGDWLANWQQMHTALFKRVYRKTGELRAKGHDVRFGNPGDEDLHHIPHGGAEVYNELYGLARNLCNSLPYVEAHNMSEVCRFLASFHYNFIRIHPFFDGNGRIARVVTDQLAVALGYIPIIAGFPRSNSEKKSAYHAAITGCIGDPAYTSLTLWIKDQLQDKLIHIA